MLEPLGKTRQLFLKRLRRIRLEQDVILEIVVTLSVKEALKTPGKTVAASMRTSPVRIDRPAERHPFLFHTRHTRLCRHLLVGFQHLPIAPIRTFVLIISCDSAKIHRPGNIDPA
ncbi:hypothetical protein D3C71_1458370 [compost metagenome]